MTMDGPGSHRKGRKGHGGGRQASKTTVRARDMNMMSAPKGGPDAQAPAQDSAEGPDTSIFSALPPFPLTIHTDGRDISGASTQRHAPQSGRD